MVARELKKWLVRAHSNRHQHEHGRRGHEALERHNEGNVVGISDTVLWKKFSGGFDGGRVESGAKAVTILPARTGCAKHPGMIRKRCLEVVRDAVSIMFFF